MTISVKFSFSWLNGFRKDVHMDFCGNNSRFAYSVKAITKNRKLEGENCYFRHDQSTLYLTCSFYFCCDSVVNKSGVNYKMKEMCMYC
jgi:hypothetical protein